MANNFSPLRNWRIGTRLFLAFGAVLCMLLSVVIVALWNLTP